MITENSFYQYYDKEHEKYNFLRNRFGFIVDNVIGPNVLDIGCGTGLTHNLIDKNFFKVGVDIEIDNINIAKQNSNAFFCQSNTILPFKNEIFDTVVCTEVIEHVDNPIETIEEIHRVVKNRLVLTCPYKGRLTKFHVRSISRKWLLNILQSKFEIKEMKIVQLKHKAIFCVGKKI
jgi:2-polyprenyl-3-methyl-5-hydroxy-6-metoxy-1,4-benzoquinol methylase